MSIEISAATTNRDLATSIVTTKFGKKITPDNLQQTISEHLKTDTNNITIYDSGFSHSTWTDPVPTTNESLLNLQNQVIGESLEAALKPLGLSIKGLDKIGVGTSFPASLDIAKNISPDAKLAVAACYSSAYWFQRFVSEAQDDHSGPCAIVGIDTITALRDGIDDIYPDGISDPVSLSFFSDGAFAIVFLPKHFKILTQATTGKEDTQHALSGKTIYPVEGQPVKGYNNCLLKRNDGTIIATFPEPKSKTTIEMSPFQTTKNFVALLKELKQNFDGVASDATHVITHQPSIKVFQKAAEIFDIKDNVSWDSENLNIPAATFGPAITRVMPKLKANDTMFTLFYGAGMNGDATLYQIK